MGKNNGKGGKGFKKRKRGRGVGLYEDDFPVSNYVDGLFYAKIESVRGDSRFIVLCEDGRTRLARACGTMRLKSWISVSDYVLISSRDFQDDKCDIVFRYNSHNTSKLRKAGTPFFQHNWLANPSRDSNPVDAGIDDGFDFEFDDI